MGAGFQFEPGATLNLFGGGLDVKLVPNSEVYWGFEEVEFDRVPVRLAGFDEIGFSTADFRGILVALW